MGSTTPPPLPYWQMNVPPSLRPSTCPDFLQNISAKDIEILSTPDDEYHVLTWPEVRSVITSNRLHLLQRTPSALRRYLQFNFNSVKEYGSVMNFILQVRVGWTDPIVAAGKPFEKDEDLCVRWNDWGYGIEEKVVHLVVWTKFDLEEDPETGDLTDAARQEIEGWVDRVFCQGMKKDNVSSPMEAKSECILLSLLMRDRLSGSKTGSHSRACMLLSISTSFCMTQTRNFWIVLLAVMCLRVERFKPH